MDNQKLMITSRLTLHHNHVKIANILYFGSMVER